MSETMLVRIKPQNRRDQHVILYGGQSYPIFKDRGWQSVPKAVAEIALDEVMSDANPDSPRVFDVKDAEGAKKIAAAETVRVDPAGTPDKPHVVKPMAIDAPEAVAAQALAPPSPAAARRGRR